MRLPIVHQLKDFSGCSMAKGIDQPISVMP
jgi:hypothetical protein